MNPFSVFKNDIEYKMHLKKAHGFQIDENMFLNSGAGVEPSEIKDKEGLDFRGQFLSEKKK